MAPSVLKGIGLKPPNPTKSAFCLSEIFSPFALFEGWSLWSQASLTVYREFSVGDSWFWNNAFCQSYKAQFIDLQGMTTNPSAFVVSRLGGLIVKSLSNIKLSWCTGKDAFFLVDHPTLCPLSCNFVHSPMYVARTLQSATSAFCLLSVQVSNYSSVVALLFLMTVILEIRFISTVWSLNP